jgi:hypothetical protein
MRTHQFRSVNGNMRRNFGRSAAFFRFLIVGTIVMLSISRDTSALELGWGKSGSKEQGGSDNVVAVFFKDSYAHHGFQYAYPDGARVSIARGEKMAHTGKASVQFDLVASDYSGGSVCLNEKTFNIKKYVKKGALRFWVKGAQGGEKAWVALVDDEKSDGHKTVVRLEIDWFGGISDKWTLVSIPLKHFGKKGVYWDAKEQREVDDKFDWERVAEFRIEIKKDDNSGFRIWVDDIQVVKSLR